mmetsp:Transcript_23995/g.66722  ORF Transcript_23995/g.66722 Transcript_23995/m.66722 type:complete len:200 (-) Transcript_23995:136-735(-)
MGGAPEKRVLLAVLVASFVFGGLSESVVKPALQEGPTDAKAMKVSEVKPHDSRTSSARAAALRHRKEALLVELASVQAKIDGRSEDPSTTGTAASGIASIPPDDVGELSNESEADEAANAEEDAIVASEYHERRRRRRRDDSRRRYRRECHGQSRQCFSHMPCQRCDCCAHGSSCRTCPNGFRVQHKYCYGRGNYQCNP